MAKFFQVYYLLLKKSLKSVRRAQTWTFIPASTTGMVDANISIYTYDELAQDSVRFIITQQLTIS
jgi:hypothetical protein